MAWVEAEDEGSIGFAEEFADDAGDGVGDEEFAGEVAFGELFTFGPEAELHVSEEEETFEEGFVELGGVSCGD